MHISYDLEFDLDSFIKDMERRSVDGAPTSRDDEPLYASRDDDGKGRPDPTLHSQH